MVFSPGIQKLVKCLKIKILYRNVLNKKSHMMIAIDKEKALDKI